MSEPEITEDDVARYWDVNAGPWAEEVRQGHDVAREWLNNPAFLAFVGDLRAREVLDAGCGEGYNTRLLARAGARMTGVDLSERMIELATAEERRAPLGIRYLRTSYAELGMLADASFDAVVSFMALMDGPRLGEALREVDGWRFTDASAEAPRFAVPRFDRTLSEYVNTLIGTGFVLRRIEEPRPSEAYCQAHPSQRGWRDHAGLFLYVRAEKPRAPTLTQEASR